MKILRQSLRNRFVHWAIAFSCFALIFTGILQMPVAKRYGLTGLGAWMGQYDLTLALHYLFAAIFVFFCCFHLFIHALEGDFDIFPRRGDFKASVEVIKAMFTSEPEPPSDKYLPEQRLAWAAFVLGFALVIVTGLLKTLKNIAGWDLPDPWLFWLAQGHNMGMALAILLFIGHMAAFIFKPNRPLLSAMFSGKVDRDYARSRHALWKEAQEEIKNN